MNDDLATVQQRSEALVSGGGRPLHVAVTPSMGILQVFGDSTAGAWASRVDMTSAAYQEERDKLVAQGLVPVRVSAQGTDADTRFAAIFAAREEVDPRTLRRRGSPGVAAIDDAVTAIMQANGVRGASLAIVKGTRLVYARGYTWAEEGYPDVQPTTRFRQASVSKTVAAFATYQLIREKKLGPDGKVFTLDTTMQSVLNLKTPTGGAPVDPNFGKITIRHLMEGTSGVDAGLIWRDTEAVQAFGAQLPATSAQLASYAASRMLSGVPGTKSIATYSNGAYFLLSQVVAKMRGAASFEAALQSSLFAPLGITRIGQSASLVGAQPAGEARYHSRPLATDRSRMSPGLPMVALGYGETNMENCDGSGGLSAAAVDLARLLAAMSLRHNNPVIDAATVTAMLANAAAASSDPGLAQAWGFHGFDRVTTIDAANGVYQGYKGGSLTTSQNGIGFMRGGLSYVISWNTPTPSGAGGSFYPYFDAVLNAAASHDWGTTDLFPKFGMASFPERGGFIQIPSNFQLQPASTRPVVMTSVSRPAPLP